MTPAVSRFPRSIIDIRNDQIIGNPDMNTYHLSRAIPLSLFRQNQQHRCFVLCVRSKLQLEIKAKLEVLDPKAAPIFVTARISRNSFNVPMFEFGAADTQIIRGKVLFDRQYVEYLKYLRAGSRPCTSFFPSYSRCMSMPYW